MRLHPLAVRLLLGAGVATFVLPSCFTVYLWHDTRPQVHSEPLAVAVDGTMIAAAPDGTVQALAVRLGDHRWLWLHDFDSPPRLATFVQMAASGQLSDVRLAIVLPVPDPVAPFRDRAALTFRGRSPVAAPFERDVPGESVRVNILCYYEEQRDLDPMPSPWPHTATSVEQEYSVSMIPGAVLLTPFAVAADVITSPIQFVAFLVSGSWPLANW